MYKTIRNVELSGKKVMIRCDFNVPMKDGKIVDDNRILKSLKTIKYAIDKNAKVILMSHLGRVKTEEDLKKNSLKVVSERLSELLEQEVVFSSVTHGRELEEKIESLKEKDVLLIENTRFEDLNGKKESSNDEKLGEYWSSLADVFINDAFGTIHREHASNVGISAHLESAIGFLVEKELEELGKLNNPKRDFIVLLGGSKVSDKIGVIQNLVKKADKILIGGGMSYTFLKASGVEIGKSLLDEENIDFCKDILSKYEDKIVLPVDTVLTDKIDEEGIEKNVSIHNIDADLIGVDIGKETIKEYGEIIKNAETILWNGPFGVYEIEKFAKGTKALLDILSHSKAISILGGGDIVGCASAYGYKDKVTHASTGGGATLAYLEGVSLPGLKNIEKK